MVKTRIDGVVFVYLPRIGRRFLRSMRARNTRVSKEKQKAEECGNSYLELCLSL